MNTFDTKSRLSSQAVGYFAPLQPATVQHLRKVYLSLGAMLLCAAIGSLVDIVYSIGGVMTFFASLGSIFWLLFTPHQEGNAENMRKRMAIAAAFAFFQGTSMGSLIKIVLSLNGGAGVVFTAFSGTTVVFACFTAAALFAERRSILFFAGVISSIFGVLFWSAIVQIFLRSELLYDIRMYLGLAAFALFVIVDTQVIIYDVQERGKHDVVSHALEFFVDFINIFVRLLIMLSKKEQKKKEEKKK